MGLFGKSTPMGRMMVGIGIAAVAGAALVLLALAGANALYGTTGPAVFVAVVALIALGLWWTVTGHLRGGE